METQRDRGLMTSGSIPKRILWFSVPLLLGNLFQQLYNAVDSAIVGRFVGKEALAAVGSSTSMINLIVSLFMGIAIGGTVCVSQYYGAREKEGLHHAIHTIAAFSLTAGVIMSVLGVLLSRKLLVIMGTPDDVIGISSLYFSIFFGGSLPLVIYNMGSGLLRAVGDSKRPLYYLIIASVLNILFDLLFVAVFRWGIAGAAFATILAESISAVMVVRVLVTTQEDYRLTIKDIRFYGRQLKNIVTVGLPSGIQNAVVGLSNVFVQSSINSFGTLAMAGCGAYMKVDGFVLLPALSFSMAMTTFIGQNMGAGNHERVKKGAFIGSCISMGTVLVIVLLLQLTARPILTLFSEDPAVVDIGIQMMHVLSMGYVLVALSHTLAGVLRGVGLTKVPMVVMIFCWCVLRMLWITYVGKPTGDLRMVLMGYPVTWVCSTVFMLLYMLKVDWIHYYEKHLR